MIETNTRAAALRALALGAFMAGAAALGVPSAQAGSDGVTGEEVLAALRNAGIRASLDTDEFDDPEITASARGTDFLVRFYGCDAGVCDSLMYSAEYIVDSAPSLQAINDWNADSIHARAYLDFVDDPFLELGVLASGGITDAAITASIDLWFDAVSDFESEFSLSNGGRDDGAARPGQAQAAAGSDAVIEVCNESGEGVSIAKATAAGENDGDGNTMFRSEGWWNLDDGECTVLWEAPFENRYYYVHASADDGHYGGDYYFCTLDEEFTIVDTQCDSDYVREAFFQIDMAEGDRMDNGYRASLDP